MLHIYIYETISMNVEMKKKDLAQNDSRPEPQNTTVILGKNQFKAETQF